MSSCRNGFLPSRLALIAVFWILSALVAGKRLTGGADPSFMQYGGLYISVGSDGGAIWIHQADSIEGLGTAEGKKIWSADTAATEDLTDVWAPEILRYGVDTYIYFAAAKKGDNAEHRMYWIHAGQPMDDWSQETKLDLPDDQWAIDGLLVPYSGGLYFVWSGWESNPSGEQNLYICRMNSPTEPTGSRYIISQPREGFEQGDSPLVNEGPEAIIDPNGQLHIVYSCNGSWRENYCLADLRLRKGGDPLYVWDWYKSNGCLFGSNQGKLMQGWDATLWIDGPGHHTFALPDGNIYEAPDGVDHYPFVFHGVSKEEVANGGYSWGKRSLYTGTYVWWSDTTYSRKGCFGCDEPLSDEGFSFKFFEDEL